MTDCLYFCVHHGDRESMARYAELFERVAPSDLVVVHPEMPDGWPGVADFIQDNIFQELHVVQPRRRRKNGCQTCPQCQHYNIRNPVRSLALTMCRQAGVSEAVLCFASGAGEWLPGRARDPPPILEWRPRVTVAWAGPVFWAYRHVTVMQPCMNCPQLNETDRVVSLRLVERTLF